MIPGKDFPLLYQKRKTEFQLWFKFVIEESSNNSDNHSMMIAGKPSSKCDCVQLIDGHDSGLKGFRESRKSYKIKSPVHLMEMLQSRCFLQLTKRGTQSWKWLQKIDCGWKKEHGAHLRNWSDVVPLCMSALAMTVAVWHTETRIASLVCFRISKSLLLLRMRNCRCSSMLSSPPKIVTNRSRRLLFTSSASLCFF